MYLSLTRTIRNESFHTKILTSLINYLVVIILNFQFLLVGNESNRCIIPSLALIFYYTLVS